MDDDVKAYEKKIQDLIDEIPDDIFIEVLEAMIYSAQISLDARREEIEDGRGL
jgi:hypothetical protein